MFNIKITILYTVHYIKLDDYDNVGTPFHKETVHLRQSWA